MATGIIYGAKSGILRRIIVHAPPSTLAQHVGKGEALAEWPEDGHDGKVTPDIAAARAFLARNFGFDDPPSPRCVVLDGAMKVTAVIMADPLLDGDDIVHDLEADIGDELAVDGKFYRSIDGQLVSLDRVQAVLDAKVQADLKATITHGAVVGP